LVISTSAGSQQNVERLREAFDQLRAGAKELASGSALAEVGGANVQKGAIRLQEGVIELADGTSQFRNGVRAIEAGLPQSKMYAVFVSVRMRLLQVMSNLKKASKMYATEASA
jgi:X-X-X-Leu-X-X-Gly heptad repeat protein